MPGSSSPAVPDALYADGTVLLQDNAVHLGADQDGDVPLREDGIEEGSRHAVAPAVLDDLIHVGEAAAGDLALAVQVDGTEGDRRVSLQGRTRGPRPAVRAQ